MQSTPEVGVYDDEGPPVPIPNTEVKLVGGENTCLATDREDSTMPTRKTATAAAAAVFFYINTDLPAALVARQGGSP